MSATSPSTDLRQIYKHMRRTLERLQHTASRHCDQAGPAERVPLTDARRLMERAHEKLKEAEHAAHQGAIKEVES